MSKRPTGKKAFFKNLKRRPKSKTDKTWNLARKNQKAISAGFEFIESETNVTTAMAGTPVITHIPPAGRGLKTRMTSVHVKGYLINATNQKVIRVDVVLDRTPLAIDPTSATLYATATPRVTAFKNINYKGRFKLLRSMLIGLDTSDIGGNTIHIIDEYIKMNHMVTTKLKDDFTNDQIQTNGVYLVYWCQTAGAEPTVNFDCRIITQDDTV